ncbi:MAG: leucine-rich repeat protein [Clostridia bacterium]|nr:leucine-rich repeat protein [Clostridia bacterium]
MSDLKDFIIKDGVLTKYTGNGGDVVIPDGVTKIGNRSFCWNTKLKTVIIPDGVTDIGDSAFYDCSKLTSVTIPDSVVSIGSQAFSECKNLLSVTLPDSLTSIGDLAFYECKKLASIAIPHGVKNIGYRLFRECTNLASVVIPDSVTSIGGEAFDGCTKLTNIIIPNSVTNIGYKVFSGCNRLSEIIVDDGNEIYASQDGVLFSKDKTCLVQYPCGKKGPYTIPKEVTTIKSDSFCGSEKLTAVIIPENVTNIGDSAFSCCSALTDVTIFANKTKIGWMAFSSCEKLKNVSLSGDFISIGSDTFRECVSLTSITIPDGVTSIEGKAFAGCTNLTNIIIPNGVTSIGWRAFSGCAKLTNITIPDSVTNIGVDAFSGCKKLSSLVCPEKLLQDFSIFGDAIPIGLVTRFENRATQLPFYDLEKYFLKKSVWKKLSEKVQTDIFVEQQDPSLHKAYTACVGDCDLLGNLLLVRLTESATEKVRLAVVNFMLLFATRVSPEILCSLYDALKSHFDDSTLKEIESNAYIMGVVGANRQNQSCDNSMPSPAIEIEMTEKEVYEKLKDFYGITAVDLPGVLDKNRLPFAVHVFAYLLFAHEKMEESWYGGKPDVVAEYEQPGVCPEAKKILALVDESSLQEALMSLANDNLGLTGRSKKMFLAYPICRYANEETMKKLTATAPKWRSSVSGNDAPPLYTFRLANRYSTTRASMLFADKYHELDAYAKLRGTDADTMRDMYLSDVGLDADGHRTYDLGNQTVIAVLQKDLTLLVELPDGKLAKSLPKKGADEQKYAEANAHFSEMKKAVKKIVKNRAENLFESFLNGKSYAAADWENAYLNNPLLRSVAELLVWQQGKRTFTLSGRDVLRADGSAYKIGAGTISVAHPINMSKEDVEAWQQYFVKHGLKQPFEQVWEPVVNPAEIASNRYAGCRIPYYRFTGRQKHGITIQDYDFHNEIDIRLEGCDAQIERLDWERHHIEKDHCFEIQSFGFKKFTRVVNHLVAYFDRITAYGRIAKDDISVETFLPQFTLAQICDFINIANENNATNVLAILLDYKNKNFADFDPMDEFVLE